MGVIKEMSRDIRLPRMVEIRQIFSKDKIGDVEAEVRRQLSQDKIRSTVSSNMEIAITAGSRGVNNAALIIRTIAQFLMQCGARPFIVPAMGSHGGATAEGQKAILTHYGITEEYCGCPVRSSMETVKIGVTSDGQDVFIDKHAAGADGIVVFGRVKPHSHFRGKYESGIMKMMAIGLGKQKGAESCHNTGIPTLAKCIPLFGNVVRTHSNVLFGLATLENAYDQTCRLVAMTRDEIPDAEPPLLEEAKALMPRIIIERGDVLVIDRIGKNYSGFGQDPNISGSFPNPFVSGGFQKQRTVFLDLSDETQGNAIGLGAADFITKRLLDKTDHELGYANCLTAITPDEYKIPIAADNQQDAIKIAVKMCTGIDRSRVRIVRIPNTMEMDRIQISETLLEEARKYPAIEILSEPKEFAFDTQGNLF